MSADRFDELARTLAGETSRRAALRGLASWAVKGVAITLGVGAATVLGTPQVAEARGKCPFDWKYCTGGHMMGSTCCESDEHCCHFPGGGFGCRPIGRPCSLG